MHRAMNCSLHNSLHNARTSSFAKVLKTRYSEKAKENLFTRKIKNNKKWKQINL